MLKDSFGLHFSAKENKELEKNIANYEESYKRKSIQDIKYLLKLRDAANASNDELKKPVFDKHYSYVNLSLAAFIGATVMTWASALLGEGGGMTTAAYGCFAVSIMAGAGYAAARQAAILNDKKSRLVDMFAILDDLQRREAEETSTNEIIDNAVAKTMSELKQEAKTQTEVDDIMRLYRTIAINVEAEQESVNAKERNREALTEQGVYVDDKGGATLDIEKSNVQQAAEQESDMEIFIVDSAISEDDIIVPTDSIEMEQSTEPSAPSEQTSEQTFDAPNEANIEAKDITNTEGVILNEGDVILRGVLDRNSVIITAKDRKQMEDFLFGETNEITETSDFMSR